MSATKKFMIFGPGETLKRMSQVILENTTPQHAYTSGNGDSSRFVDVFVYEEHQKLLNSSLSVTLIIETNSLSVRVEVVTTGGRMGFSGSAPTEEIALNEVITDQIVDFSKRFGLTIQEVADKTNTDLTRN